MTDWLWVDVDVALAVHDEQLAQHGGLAGVSDHGELESAMARPQNHAGFGTPDAAALAAAYAFGLARNHPFADGNKRTALVVSELFLALNGFELLADDAECVVIILSLAAGTTSESELTDWFRDNSSAATAD